MRRMESPSDEHPIGRTAFAPSDVLVAPASARKRSPGSSIGGCSATCVVGSARRDFRRPRGARDAPVVRGRERALSAERVEVPHEHLAPEVLLRLIEEFVTRDGTDYGAVERTLGEKVALVMRQLEAGELAIMVDTEDETIDIVARPPF